VEKIFKIKENISFQQWRTRFIVLAIIFFFCIVIIRSFYLQVITGEKLSKKGRLGYARTVLHSNFRGNIFDRNMFPLATSVPVDSIGIDPTSTNIRSFQIEQIENYLDVNLDSLRKNILTKKRKFLYIKRHINSAQLKAIMNMKISGLTIIKEQKRYYPLGEIS
jgi:cell division protein FtsI/penicillin-binding protein 2